MKNNGRQFKTYTGEYTTEISFPLGGIGTGCIGLAGNGRLIDWEIFNRPNKNSSTNGYSFFAVKCEKQDGTVFAKVLNGDLNNGYNGNGDADWTYGFGVKREYLSGMPHFKNVEFSGTFPFATLNFIEDNSPIDVKMTAFNPFIPLNNRDSSIPGAIFMFEVTNKGKEEVKVSLAGSLSNPFNKGGVNTYTELDEVKSIKYTTSHYDKEDVEYGDMTLSTMDDEVSKQTYWYRGEWFDNLMVFWDDFSKTGSLKDRVYEEVKDSDSWNATVNFCDVGTLCSDKTISPGETKTFRFMIHWNFPNFINYWNPGKVKNPKWKNYYATIYKDSQEAMSYTWKHIDRLYEETICFRDTLFSSTYPDFIIDAIASNLSVLKSATCTRLTDGTLYGFEGCHTHAGCCEGSCTHVWNYVQSTAFLFPSLERSMREIDYKSNQDEHGKMFFRMLLPPGRGGEEQSNELAGTGKAAADGQMGGIFKTYREWKISGDDNWLASIWPSVKKALEYAWSEDNDEWWDLDADGIMEGIQHHTLDVDMYGPNSYIAGYYMLALKTASEMAEAVNDADAKKYMTMFENGKEWVNNNLFNGEYFHQKIDLTDSKYPIDEEIGEMKYQIGEGCHIDQVIGQWYAHILGIGYIFDKEKVVKSLKSIHKYNFVDSFREYPNPYRVYALNDEKGTVICTWPNGNRPKVPVPYAAECMTGFEYQLASHMIYEGLVDEAFKMVEAIRNRYDGKKRNPYNEIECGSNYARSMASYGLLLALSGFDYDMRKKHIGFTPKVSEDKYNTFWCVNSAWGSYESYNNEKLIQVKYGLLQLKSIGIENAFGVKKVYTIDKELPFEIGVDSILLEDVTLKAGQWIKIVVQ
ncbi:MAG: non-lysosomal glucosylceramidase [Vallitalea sp.]|nr:non-lysosomal glucosylceramidase [Vallitalea sp.]